MSTIYQIMDGEEWMLKNFFLVDVHLNNLLFSTVGDDIATCQENPAFFNDEVKLWVNIISAYNTTHLDFFFNKS